MGEPCVICQDTSHNVAPSHQGEQLRTGKSDVYQQPIASLSPESSRVKEDPSRSRDNVFVSVSHSYDKTSRLCVQTKRCWTLAEDLLSEWEEGKKSRAGGGAPCESRKIVLCGKRFLSRSGFSVAAGRRRGDGEVVERCRCACHELFFMLCLARHCISTEHLLQYAWTCVCFQ